MKDIKKTIRRLLNLSQLVLDEIEVLANLSYHDRENTEQFNDHIHDIKDYLNQERVILNNASFTDLLNLFSELTEYDDDSDAYLRCFVNIDDRLNKYMDEHENTDENTDENIEEIQEIVDRLDERDDEDKETDNDYLLKYHVDEGKNEKYAINVIDNISTIVIKKMLNRILNTLADNKQDSKYKKVLIRNFKKFKYLYFTLDNQLEFLGASYQFDVDKIPMPYPLSIDTSDIFHNQCVTILDKLYALKEMDYTPDKMEETLFNMMMLEEYLTGINDESVDKLVDLTQELEQRYGINYFGNIAKQKVLTKRS